MSLHTDISEVLITAREIQQRITTLGGQLTEDYATKNPMIIGVLKGSALFMSDLVRKLDFPVEIDFMAVSSYGNAMQSQGVVHILKDLDESITGRHVLIVEDIIDTGLTLTNLLHNLERRKPKSVRVCTLLDKQDARKIPLTPDYSCFTIPNVFVVGYGLDYAQKYRNLPYVGILKPAIYGGE